MKTGPENRTSQEKKTVSLWLGVAIVSILCTLLLAKVQNTVEDLMFWNFDFGYDTASGVTYYLRSPQEVLRTAWGYSDDYWLAPEQREERLERSAQEAVRWRMEEYQELLEELNTAKEEKP